MRTLAILLLIGSAWGHSGQRPNKFIDNALRLPNHPTNYEQWYFVSDEPIVVPAVRKFCHGGPMRECCFFDEEIAKDYTFNPEHCHMSSVNWHCADGKRILLHSDDGTLHVCLKLPEIPEVKP